MSPIPACDFKLTAFSNFSKDKSFQLISHPRTNRCDCPSVYTNGFNFIILWSIFSGFVYVKYWIFIFDCMELRFQRCDRRLSYKCLEDRFERPSWIPLKYHGGPAFQSPPPGTLLHTAPTGDTPSYHLRACLKVQGSDHARGNKPNQTTYPQILAAR